MQTTTKQPGVTERQQTHILLSKPNQTKQPVTLTATHYAQRTLVRNRDNVPGMVTIAEDVDKAL